MNKPLEKRGFTLIELVVSMGILVMVFAGTMTLIMAVVNLTYNARQKTEVVVLAQKTLTEQIIAYRTNPRSLTPITGTLPNGIVSNVVTISTSVPPGAFPSQVMSVGFIPANFVMIKVTITWRPKGATANTTYTLSQAIIKEKS